MNELRLVVGDERYGIPAFGEAVRGAEHVDVRLVARHGDELRELRFGRFPYASRHRRTIERIQTMTRAWIEEEEEHASRDLSVLPLWTPPPPARSRRTRDALLFLVQEARRFAHHALRFLFEEVRWDVAVSNTSVERFLQAPRNAWLHWLARDRSEFLADPFVARAENGGTRVLCETMDGSWPSIVEIDLNDRFGARRPVLPHPGPASYPYVFDVDGEQWLVPEQHRRRSIHAYRLNGLCEPLEAPIHTGIAAVDPTVVEHDGRWWLFCADEDDGPNYALRIFWAKHPRGPWTPHARNPAKIDVRGARPAGNFFLRDGRLHRPAQDCSARYGGALVIHRIDVLTPQAFEETPVARIEASMLARNGAVGVHTLSHGEGWVAIDAQFTHWSLCKPLRILRGERA